MLSVPNFRQHLLSFLGELVNAFSAKFQATFVVFFLWGGGGGVGGGGGCHFFSNYRLERSLYVKLKDCMSNSIDPDETAHYKPSHLDLSFLQKPIIIAFGSERVKLQTVKPGQPSFRIFS